MPASVFINDGCNFRARLESANRAVMPSVEFVYRLAKADQRFLWTGTPSESRAVVAGQIICRHLWQFNVVGDDGSLAKVDMTPEQAAELHPDLLEGMVMRILNFIAPQGDPLPKSLAASGLPSSIPGSPPATAPTVAG